MRGEVWSRGLALAASLALGACSSDERPTFAVPYQDDCFGRTDGVLCDGAEALTCLAGTIDARQDCSTQGLVCAPRAGCRTCVPRSTTCQGPTRSRCTDDGSSMQVVEECPEGTWCSELGCVDLCAEAAADRSYLGCEYWPVFTSNRELDARFQPAVSIGNGNLVSAHVVITKGEQVVSELTVLPRTATTVELAFSDELKNGAGSRLVRAGAYRLRSTVPVTVHQYNPLYFELPGACATDDPGDGQPSDVCNSFTNDASLLFPATALRRDPESTDNTHLSFLTVSRSSFVGFDEGGALHSAPGFVAITAVDTAPVTVRIKASAHLAASPELATDPIEAVSAGGELVRTLSQGDVLQLRSSAPTSCVPVTANGFCDPGSAYDLTGTEVSADGAIQVVSGHDCSNVPFERRACDHLEESMVPLHAWGRSAVLSLPQKLNDSVYVVRILSGADENQITFDPSTVHAPVTLGRGQWVELRATTSVHVSGSGRLMAAQYLVGQGGGLKVGDPSLSIAVPVDQYRARYNFVSPATYLLNYVDIIAGADDVVTLDGALVRGFTQVGSSGFRVATVQLEQSGAHEVRGTSVFGLGVVLYGVGRYTSYMLPGGLNLASLAMGI